MSESITITRAFKFRMKPNKTQAEAMERAADVRRWVWNKCVDWCDLYLVSCDFADYKPEWGLLCGPKGKPGSLVNRPPKMLSDWLKIWRRDWSVPLGEDANGERIQVSLKDIGTYNQQQNALVAFANAWRRYFAMKDTGARPPKFKGRFDSVRFRDTKKDRIVVRDDRIKVAGLTKKIQYVKFIKHRDIEGEILSLAFSRVAGHWYVSVTCRIERSQKQPASDDVVGVDMGVAKNATTSDGQVFLPHESISSLRGKLAHHQHKLTKCVKGSNSYKKRKAMIAKVQKKMADCRNHLSHQVSRELTSKYRTIAVEDLKIANMTRSAAGTVEDPGKNVAAKSGLNRAILDQAWGATIEQIQYKSEEYGGEVIKVDPRNTSRKCSVCGYTAKENRTEQSIFECQRCFHTANADVNAAKNIRDAAVGVVFSSESCKTEPSVNKAPQALAIVEV